MGIVAALTGNPSTPWHLTIGNPLRPVFCSGDMLVDDVTLKLGPILAFNDLPSTITAEFTVSNARPWGMQEIMAKFNSGYLRTVDIQKTYFETNISFGAEKATSEPTGILPGAAQSVASGDTSKTDIPVVTSIIGTPSTAGTPSNTNTNANLTNPNADIPLDPKGQSGSNISATDPKGQSGSVPTQPLKSVDTGTKGAPGSDIKNAGAALLANQTKQEGGGKI